MSTRQRARYLRSLKAGIIQKIVGLLLIVGAITMGDISFMVLAIPGGLGLLITKKWVLLNPEA